MEWQQERMAGGESQGAGLITCARLYWAPDNSLNRGHWPVLGSSWTLARGSKVLAPFCTMDTLNQSNPTFQNELIAFLFIFLYHKGCIFSRLY